ncbi:MAG: nucleoside hydrolase [Oscillospiraceae bacterium]|nr:nucleoside hydrolase [Oscillospiraceae bacterium]
MDTITLIKNLERPKSKIDVILDTDAYNEIDDQFAIAYMFANKDKLNIKALYAAPFHNSRSTGPKDGMEKSYDEIKKVIALIEDTDAIEVYKGSERYLSDEKTPVISPAAEHLAKLAQNYSASAPLYVVAIGAITNIASAILINPKITDNIVVVWLGGNAHHWHDTKEFNLYQDVAAARIIFGCGVPFVQLPCMGVVSSFTISEAELEKWLLGKNKICDYLARNTIEEASSYAGGKPWTRIIWDVTAVAWLVDGRFFCERLERSPIPEYDGYYAYDGQRHFMKYIYHINRDALAEDLFNKLLALD